MEHRGKERNALQQVQSVIEPCPHLLTSSLHPSTQIPSIAPPSNGTHSAVSPPSNIDNHIEQD